jgi:hypothetical protein
MSTASALEKIQQMGVRGDERFQLQLKAARDQSSRVGPSKSSDSVAASRGVDRSGNLEPIERPTIVRTLTNV